MASWIKNIYEKQVSEIFRNLFTNKPVIENRERGSFVEKKKRCISLHRFQFISEREYVNRSFCSSWKAKFCSYLQPITLKYLAKLNNDFLLLCQLTLHRYRLHECSIFKAMIFIKKKGFSRKKNCNSLENCLCVLASVQFFLLVIVHVRYHLRSKQIPRPWLRITEEIGRVFSR